MDETTAGILQKPHRINAVDSIRGFAVIGIIMIHFIEHMNFYAFPELTTFDKGVWDTVFYLGASKMYAIFALLFGLSCYIQHHNRELRGEDFRLRYAWRMLLLFGWGMLDLVFYNGDILCTYAVLGLFLIPLVKVRDAVLYVVAAILFIQPIELGYIVAGLFDSSTLPMDLGSGSYFGAVFGPCIEGGFLDVARANLMNGLQINFLWAIEHGRLTQTLLLFVIGMLLGRKRLFIDEGSSMQFWKKVILFWSLPLFAVSQSLLCILNFDDMQPCVGFSLELLFTAWRNFAMMSIYVAGLTLLYYRTPLRSVIHNLSYIGKMSLSDYLIQSAAGGFLFYHYGLELWKVCGHTRSLLLGILFCICLYFFCRFWCRHFHRGPLEELWARAMNVKLKRE